MLFQHLHWNGTKQHAFPALMTLTLDKALYFMLCNTCYLTLFWIMLLTVCGFYMSKGMPVGGCTAGIYGLGDAAMFLTPKTVVLASIPVVAMPISVQKYVSVAVKLPVVSLHASSSDHHWSIGPGIAMAGAETHL
jgi:hypothetical protein